MIAPSLIELARQKIAHAKDIVVVSHLRPDGDAVGSLLGLGLALENAGKKVQMVLSDGLPDSFKFLEGSEKIITKTNQLFELVIAVDSSDLQRIGKSLQDHKVPDISIDHHFTNENFATLNLIDGEAAATAEILAACLPGLGLSFTLPVVNALMVGIITDTIGFRTNNLRPLTMRLAADLMEAGADLPDLYKRTLAQRSFSAMRYWGAGLINVQLMDHLAWTSLTLEDRKKAGYSGRDDADLINILSSMKEAHVVIVFVEQSRESVKISWRSQNGYDVSRIAQQFGGGGHLNASGAEVNMPLAEAQIAVLEATKTLFQSKIPQ